jgi:hypothetical protein
MRGTPLYDLGDPNGFAGYLAWRIFGRWLEGRATADARHEADLCELRFEQCLGKGGALDRLLVPVLGMRRGAPASAIGEALEALGEAELLIQAALAAWTRAFGERGRSPDLSRGRVRPALHAERPTRDSGELLSAFVDLEESRRALSEQVLWHVRAALAPIRNSGTGDAQIANDARAYLKGLANLLEAFRAVADAAARRFRL